HEEAQRRGPHRATKYTLRYDPGVVTIELFGVPRLRAGRAALEVDARSVGEALRALARACPELEPAVVEGGRLARHYLLALNGAQLLRDDPSIALAPGDVLVVVSAEAGG